MEILDYILFNYLSAIILIVLGIRELNNTLKKTTRDIDNVLQPFISGIVFSVGLIIMGGLIIIFKILGKL